MKGRENKDRMIRKNSTHKSTQHPCCVAAIQHSSSFSVSVLRNEQKTHLSLYIFNHRKCQLSTTPSYLHVPGCPRMYRKTKQNNSSTSKHRTVTSQSLTNQQPHTTPPPNDQIYKMAAVPWVSRPLIVTWHALATGHQSSDLDVGLFPFCPN